MSGTEEPGHSESGGPGQLSRDDVVHVANLARLALSEDEVDLFTAQLRTVLAHAADVAALDLSHLAPMAHPLPVENVLRPDEPRPCLDRAEVLAAAPSVEDHRFRVPRIGGEPRMSSAREVAAAVRAGERSAREVTEEALAAVAARDGEIHAFLAVLADEALAQADAVDAAVAEGQDPGPLAGVPVALKDNLCTRGIPTTCASKILEGWRPPYDATVVELLRAAGAIALGKTNMDEFAMGSSTENSAFGPTRNPHCIDRVPGGSSGGSAAAVAAGFAPLGLGSDTGGSIRQPAALCGVVGMKPTYGRVSRYGLVAFASSLDQIGPFAANVEDAALLFDVLARHDPCDTTSLRHRGPADARRRGRGSGRACASGCAPSSSRAARPTWRPVSTRRRRRCARPGRRSRRSGSPSSPTGCRPTTCIAPAEASSNLARYDGVRYGLRVDADDAAAMNTATRTAGFGAEVKRRIMLGTYALSAGYYDAYYAQAQRVRTLVVEAFERAYASVDVLLGATAPTTAFALGDKVDDPMAMYMNDICTIPSNLAGHPAVSVPFGAGADGLPVGVQVLAPALDEQLLFQVAGAVEAGAADRAGWSA